jgi:competence protein ComEA
MPFRRRIPPTDLERVARILGQRPAGSVTAGDPDDGHDASLLGRMGRAIDDATPRSDEASRLDTQLRRARRPGPLTVPDVLRGSRRTGSSTAIVALLALVVAVGCVFVLRVLWAERAVAPAVAPSATGPVVVGSAPVAADARVSGGDGREAGGASFGASVSPTGAATGGPGAEVVVHVVGRVAHPGVVRLRQGSRVADAIARAGGATRGADLGALNLARLLVDGEQVHVPRIGEPPAAQAGAVTGGVRPPGDGTAGSAPGSDQGGATGQIVSLNTADLATLDTLPGVGPVLAQRILEWRTAHGRFASVDELGEVSGIGDKLMARLRPRVAL